MKEGTIRHMPDDVLVILKELDDVREASTENARDMWRAGIELLRATYPEYEGYHFAWSSNSGYLHVGKRIEDGTPNSRMLETE